MSKVHVREFQSEVCGICRAVLAARVLAGRELGARTFCWDPQPRRTWSKVVRTTLYMKPWRGRQAVNWHPRARRHRCPWQECKLHKRFACGAANFHVTQHIPNTNEDDCRTAYDVGLLCAARPRVSTEDCCVQPIRPARTSQMLC